MSPMEKILQAAKETPRRIVLSEGEDPRIQEGARRAAREGLARVTLLGEAATIGEALSDQDGVEIIDPATSPRIAAYAERYHELRRHKGVDLAKATATMAQPLAFAAMMVREGDADGTIGGAVATTADTVRAALQIIGPAPGVKTVSSFFLMMLTAAHHPKQGALVFADCGLVVEPSVTELADIAIASAESYRQLVQAEPRVALLSFSTQGSARHERVERVQEAVRRAHALRPELTLDGELQFDAAFVPAVGAAKAPRSPIGGEANVFVFPTLEAANIGYKIAQRIGGALAIGPVLQGLAKPANDLSRGCSADDVYHMIAVTALQAAAKKT